MDGIFSSIDERRILITKTEMKYLSKGVMGAAWGYECNGVAVRKKRSKWHEIEIFYENWTEGMVQKMGKEKKKALHPFIQKVLMANDRITDCWNINFFSCFEEPVWVFRKLIFDNFLFFRFQFFALLPLCRRHSLHLRGVFGYIGRGSLRSFSFLPCLSFLSVSSYELNYGIILTLFFLQSLINRQTEFSFKSIVLTCHTHPITPGFLWHTLLIIRFWVCLPMNWIMEF